MKCLHITLNNLSKEDEIVVLALTHTEIQVFFIVLMGFNI